MPATELDFCACMQITAMCHHLACCTSCNYQMSSQAPLRTFCISTFSCLFFAGSFASLTFVDRAQDIFDPKGHRDEESNGACYREKYGKCFTILFSKPDHCNNPDHCPQKQPPLQHEQNKGDYSANQTEPIVLDDLPGHDRKCQTQGAWAKKHQKQYKIK